MTEEKDITKQDKETLNFIVGFAIGKGVCEFVNPEALQRILKKLV